MKTIRSVFPLPRTENSSLLRLRCCLSSAVSSETRSPAQKRSSRIARSRSERNVEPAVAKMSRSTSSGSRKST